MISNPAAAPNKHTLLRSLSLDPADAIKSTLEKTPFKSCCFGMVVDESNGEGNSFPLAQIKSLVPADKKPTAEEAGILGLEFTREKKRERI